MTQSQIVYSAIPTEELKKRVKYYRDNLRCKDKYKNPWLEEMREVWQQLLAECEKALINRN